MHALTHGVDNYLRAKDFASSDIMLTKSKGIACAGLSEFIILGMLWHAKHVKSFMDK